MKEKVALIQRTLFRGTDVTELGVSALIEGDGANQCNAVLENARRKCRVGPTGRSWGGGTAPGCKAAQKAQKEASECGGEPAEQRREGRVERLERKKGRLWMIVSERKKGFPLPPRPPVSQSKDFEKRLRGEKKQTNSKYETLGEEQCLN